MNTTVIETTIAGKSSRVAAAKIDGRTVITTGRWLKIAGVLDEELICGPSVNDPASFVDQLRASPLGADIFTFGQRIPDVKPIHGYHYEWDNAAALPLTTYDDWWSKDAEADVRKAVKKSARLGVEVRIVPFDDTLVQGIVEVYNDSPIRQGKPFWHYGKPFEQVKRENGTYLERSEFIGAYLGNELLGFIKLVYMGNVAATMQVISKKSAYDKKVINALLARTVALCTEKCMTHLVYGSFIYGQANSLTEFKRRHGFREVLLPRYYVPLTAIGRAALQLRLHQGVRRWLPPPIAKLCIGMRERWVIASHKARRLVNPRPASIVE